MTESARGAKARAVDQLQAYFESGTFAPGTLLPSEAELTERFGLSKYMIREALAELRRRGVIETENGRGSTLPRLTYLQLRTRRDDPAAMLEAISEPEPSRDRADAATARLFGVRDRAPLFLLHQRHRHRASNALVLTIRTIPAEPLFPLIGPAEDEEPDPVGPRADLLKALNGHYGDLAVTERIRFLLKPDVQLASRLDMPSDERQPVTEVRRMHRTREGRLLMIESTFTEAATAEWEYEL